jgi:hypothetical protein
VFFNTNPTIIIMYNIIKILLLIFSVKVCLKYMCILLIETIETEIVVEICLLRRIISGTPHLGNAIVNNSGAAKSWTSPLWAHQWRAAAAPTPLLSGLACGVAKHTTPPLYVNYTATGTRSMVVWFHATVYDNNADMCTTAHTTISRRITSRTSKSLVRPHGRESSSRVAMYIK